MSKQSVFYIEYHIGHYDLPSGEGVASSLDKAVEYCQKKIKEDSYLTPYDIDKGSGYLIVEYVLDELSDNSVVRTYQCNGKVLFDTVDQ